MCLQFPGVPRIQRGLAAPENDSSNNSNIILNNNMKTMQILRSRHVFAVPRCPPASHEDSQPPDPSNTPAHIPPSPPSHNRPGDDDNNYYYLYHDDGNDNNDDDCDDDDAGDDDDDQ